MYLVFVILVILDQATKAIFADRGFSFLDYDFHPTNNHALPFGLNFGGLWNFIILAFITVAVSWFISRLPESGKWNYFGKSVFFAGVASNLVDRIMFGYVRDFIDLSLGFIFNLADVFIVLGLIIILFTTSSPKTKSDTTPTTV